MGIKTKDKPLAKLTPEQINKITIQVKEDIRKTIYEWLWKWIQIIAVILATGIGITFYGIYLKATALLQNLLVSSISEEFKQPTIRKTIEDVAAKNAKEIFINEIMPEVTKFKADIHNEVGKQEKAINNLEKGQSTIAERVNEIESKVKGQLKQEYPNGYAILGFTSEHAVVSHSEYVPEGVNVNWNKTKVIAITEDTIKVRFPDINIGEGISLTSNTISLHNKVGSSVNIIDMKDWRLFASVLSIQKDLIVIAIGFEPKK